MKYRVDLLSRASVVVDAEDEDHAIKMAENYANSSPVFRPIFEIEGVEETDDDADIKEE